jgi:hypothetical protein
MNMNITKMVSHRVRAWFLCRYAYAGWTPMFREAEQRYSGRLNSAIQGVWVALFRGSEQRYSGGMGRAVQEVWGELFRRYGRYSDLGRYFNIPHRQLPIQDIVVRTDKIISITGIKQITSLRGTKQHSSNNE